jgi:membrane protein YdbS with pleckstrin-like domain
MSARPYEPPPTSNTLTRDPVRWTWVLYGLIQAVITVLLATEAIDQEVAAIITGVALALYVAVSELFTRPETVPRVPLEQLAARTPPPPIP